MSDIVSINPSRPTDRDGLTVPGALAYFYLSGTTTPQEVYTTAAGDVAHPIPLEADAEGVFPPIFSAVALKCTVTDASGNVLPGYPVDPVAIIPTGSGASSITFEPTADIPETNVQSAIERVQLNLVAPLLAGGIGVTGNAPLLANIDATNTASGAYRYEAGASGTFPSGVTAAAGGTIRLWRETAAEATMELSPRGENHTWQRTLTSSSWGLWQKMPLDSSSAGRVLLTAADAAAQRTALQVPPIPTSSTGAGQFVVLNPGVAADLVLPAGGVWAYFYMTFVVSTGVNNFVTAAGTAAGGTTVIGGTTNLAFLGFAWRVS